MINKESIPNTMPFDVAKELVDNYRNHQLRSIIESTTSPMEFDAHSLWFSIESMKEYINEIEREVAAHPELPTANLGLRFYYAAYPDAQAWTNQENVLLQETIPVYEKLHTLIVLPTTEINGDNYDFNPLDPATYSGNPPTEQTQVMVSKSTITVKNHGFLVPPSTATGEWF